MIKYNGYAIGKGGFWLKAAEKPVDPYNPYDLGPGVVRLTFHYAGYDPNTDLSGPGYGHWERVSGGTWDFYPEGTGLEDKFNRLAVSFVLESWNLRDYSGPVYASFRGSNIANINNPIDFSMLSATNDISEMFAQSHIVHVCPGIRLIPNGNARNMFRNCQALFEIPIFDWDYVPGEISGMFGNTYNVERGITILYDNWSGIRLHDACFKNCGVNTPTGAAELAQIPSDWK